MASMTRFLCLRAGDPVKHTRHLIGLAFVLGCMITQDGWSQPRPPMIYAQLELRGTPDLSISSPRHLFEITTSPSSRLPLPTALSFKAFPPLNQNGTAVSNTMELGSTSCARLITSMKPTMEYSLPSVLKTHVYRECSRLLPPHQSQKN